MGSDQIDLTGVPWVDIVRAGFQEREPVNAFNGANQGRRGGLR